MTKRKNRVLLINEGNIMRANGLHQSWLAWRGYLKQKGLPDFFIEVFISFLREIKSQVMISQAEFEAFERSYDAIRCNGKELVLVATNPLPDGAPGKKSHQVGVEIMAKTVLESPPALPPVPMKLYYFLDDRRTGRDTRIIMAGSETEAWTMLADLYKLSPDEAKKRFKPWSEQTKNCDHPQVVI